MMRFWMSWYQPGPDERPVTYPPPKPILGWWTSGETEEVFTICAVVEANSEADAWGEVENIDAWPDRGEKRFCKIHDGVLGDRFPLSDWMKPRFATPNRKAPNDH